MRGPYAFFIVWLLGWLCAFLPQQVAILNANKDCMHYLVHMAAFNLTVSSSIPYIWTCLFFSFLFAFISFLSGSCYGMLIFIMPLVLARNVELFLLIHDGLISSQYLDGPFFFFLVEFGQTY